MGAGFRKRDLLRRTNPEGDHKRVEGPGGEAGWLYHAPGLRRGAIKWLPFSVFCSFAA